MDQTVLFRSSESKLASPAWRFAFDGDGHLLRLASEALRIRVAHLFDPFLAVAHLQSWKPRMSAFGGKADFSHIQPLRAIATIWRATLVISLLEAHMFNTGTPDHLGADGKDYRADYVHAPFPKN